MLTLLDEYFQQLFRMTLSCIAVCSIQRWSMTIFAHRHVKVVYVATRLRYDEIPIYYKFTAKSVGERIWKIGQHLAKIKNGKN